MGVGISKSIFPILKDWFFKDFFRGQAYKKIKNPIFGVNRKISQNKQSFIPMPWVIKLKFSWGRTCVDCGGTSVREKFNHIREINVDQRIMTQSASRESAKIIG